MKPNQTTPSSEYGRTIPPPRRTLGFAACALAGTLWGTGFYFGKVALTELSVGYMVLYRFLFACIGLAPILVRHRPTFNAREWRILLFAAFLGVPLQFLGQFAGLARTTVSHASLMVGTMPVLLALGATLFSNEQMDRIGWLALAASTIGAALIVLGGKHSHAAGQPTLTGDLMVVGSLVIALFWILMCQRLMLRHTPLVVTAYGIASGTIMLALWVIGRETLLHGAAGLPPIHLSANVWIALAISGLLCTATTSLLWNWGITHVPASQGGVFLNLEPLIGSVMGVALLGEHLGPGAFLGGTLILAAAITLTTRPQGHAESMLLE